MWNLITTLIGAFLGSGFGYYLAVRHEKSKENDKATIVRRVRLRMVLTSTQSQLAIIRNTRSIIDGVGKPPHDPANRNVFYPMYLRSRLLDTSIYASILSDAENDFDERYLMLFQDIVFAVEQLKMQIENLSLTWEDASNLPKPLQVRQELWEVFNKSLQAGDGLIYTQRVLQDAFTAIAKDHPELYNSMRHIEGIKP